ncbi:hypothetical protein QFZ75_004429 [Streptomyces sp. V3I8]|uniref:hypothetical protein n=1 Tax=Streptomyces sp. V3I8 TaxID=3042279 RepID=UPI0027869935|nr:hypothetical protein [Streptomyces sp. V3I8]MDQ1038013.1 hypothetical protein [Streptomyces sp. V3I8]
MNDATELGEREFIGRRGGDRARLVPAEVIATVPEARAMAQSASTELRFDFLDDRAVLRMLRLRHADEEAMFAAGFRTGVPLAVIGFGAAVYWGGAAQYWESGRAQMVYLVVAGAVVLSLLALYIRTAVAHWRDPVRQNLRARARKYREVAHTARRGGAAVPAHYPYYGPYPFAAGFHPEAEETEETEEAQETEEADEPEGEGRA